MLVWRPARGGRSLAARPPATWAGLAPPGPRVTARASLGPGRAPGGPCGEGRGGRGGEGEAEAPAGRGPGARPPRMRGPRGDRSLAFPPPPAAPRRPRLRGRKMIKGINGPERARRSGARLACRRRTVVRVPASQRSLMNPPSAAGCDPNTEKENKGNSS